MAKLIITFSGLLLILSSAISTPIVANHDQNDSVIFPTDARSYPIEPAVQNENNPGDQALVNENIEARSGIGKEPHVLLRNHEHFPVKPLHFPDVPEPQPPAVSEHVSIAQPPVPVIPHPVPVAPHHVPVVQKHFPLKHDILHKVKERLSHLPRKLHELKNHIPLLKTHHIVPSVVHRGHHFIAPVGNSLFEHQVPQA